MKANYWEASNFLPHRSPVRDWKDLSTGDIIEVRTRGEHKCFARVDGVSEDAQGMWLVTCDAGVRFHQNWSDSVTLYPVAY